MKISKVYDGTDPGATPGRVFSGSIGQEEIIPDGAFLDHLTLGLKGAISSAAVALENFAGVLSEYTVRVGAETRILMDGGDLCALMKFFYKQLPVVGENTDNTGTDLLGGIKIPIQAPVEASKPITHAATRTAVGNVATETLAISAWFDENANGKKPIHAVKISHTTAGSTGYEVLGFRIVPVGKLIGLIIGQPNGFDDTNISLSIQRLKILADGEVHSALNPLADTMEIGTLDYVTPAPLADLLRPYMIFDFRESGIDAKGQELTLQLDIQDASDAIDIIPILEIE